MDLMGKVQAVDQEIDRAYGYAVEIAITLHKKHYADDAPEWEPCEDLFGVLMQIDNMTSDLVREDNNRS